MNSRTTPEEAAVHAAGLVKTYEDGRIRALDGLNLEIARGEFVAVCGPSGCGKTTLLNMITAIDLPDLGRLVVCATSLADLTPGQADDFRASVVGLVFQFHNLLPNLTALENVQVPMLGNGQSPGERVRRAGELLDRIRLSDKHDALPVNLSGGERQRVAVARALANRPELLLADEPTGALDSTTGKMLMDLLCDLQRSEGLTLLLVTHDPVVADRAERIIHMLDGRISNGPTS